MAILTVRRPDGTRFVCPLERDVLTFGKSSGNDLVLEARGISRHHGRLYRGGDGQWWVEDLGSANGTIVRGGQIQKRRLEDGDAIAVGQVQLLFASEGQGASTRGSSLSISDAPQAPGSTLERPASSLAVRDSARLMALYDFAKRLMGRRDVPGLVDEASATLMAALHAQMVVFGLTRDPEKESDRVLVRPAHLAGGDVVISRSVLKQTIQGQQAVLIGETGSDLDTPRSESMIASGIRSVLCVPMLRDREVTGFVYIDNRRRGRSYEESDLEFACAIGAMLATAIENARLIEGELVKERLEMELAGARRVQQAILPSEWPAMEGWDIYGDHITCREVGGDYCDAILASSGRLWLLMADVAGKGAPAALLASRVHAMTQGLLETCDSPARLLTALNNLVVRRSPQQLFVTCLVMAVRPDTGDALIATAGHPGPLYVRPGEKAQPVAVSPGDLLGVEPGATYQDTVWHFPGGAGTLLLYTDGVTEAFGRKDEQFGKERLGAAISSSADCPAREVVQAVQRAVEVFRADQAPSDDLTLLACRRLPSSP